MKILTRAVNSVQEPKVSSWCSNQGFVKISKDYQRKIIFHNRFLSTLRDVPKTNLWSCKIGMFGPGLSCNVSG